MAEIHPDVRGLLNALSASGFAQLVQLCAEQIERKDQPQAISSDLSPAVRRRVLREQRRLRGQTQLSILDGVISGALEEELRLTVSLRASAETLAIRNVVLLPLPTELPALASSFEQLLSGNREAAISRFLSIWNEVIGDARARLGVS